MEKSSISTSNSTNLDAKSNPSVPTAAILCLAIGAYIILTIVALLIRRYMKSQVVWERSTCCQSATCSCNCGHCERCCRAFENTLSVCKSCTTCTFLNQSYSKCCRCPTLPSFTCCLGSPLLLECGRCNCTCGCQLPECHSINCFCFEINIA